MGTSLQQTRDSLGHADQTKEQVFVGDMQEELRINKVNEVIKGRECDGTIFDTALNGGFDNNEFGFDGTLFIQDTKVRKRWQWRTTADLNKTPTAKKRVTDGGIEINLTRA